MSNASDFFPKSGSGKSVSFFSGTLTIASGASGDILIITPPIGKRVTITSLLPTSVESGITISGSESGEVIDSKNLQVNNTQSTGSFMIGQSSSTSSNINNAGFLLELPFEIDEVVTVSKDSGTTGSIIYYSFTYGS